MDYDNDDKLMLKIVEFGWLQKRALLFLFVPAFVGGLVVMTTAFTTKIPEEFSCNIKCDHLVTPKEDGGFEVLAHNNMSKSTIFNILKIYDDQDYLSKLLEKPENCLNLKAAEEEEVSEASIKKASKNKIIKALTLFLEWDKACDRDSDYFFEHFAMDTTVITDHKALCMVGIKVYKSVCDTLFMVGYLFGGSFFGMVADSYGGKKSVCLAIFFCFFGSGLDPLLLTTGPMLS